MHYSVYVLLPKEEAQNSLEARTKVSEYLSDNNFCQESSGRWGGGIGDWFVIGGRWSGSLTNIRLDEEQLKKFWDAFEEKGLQWTSLEKPQTQQAHKSRLLFKKFFPRFDLKKTSCPVYRDQYHQNGFEDDAQVIDEEIWTKIIEPGLKKNIYEGGSIIHTEDIDLESVSVKEEVLNKCWCVVVDFHN